MAFKVGNSNVINQDRSVVLGAGETRPSSPIIGTLWYNTQLGYIEVFDGSSWVSLTPSSTSVDNYARTTAFLGL